MGVVRREGTSVRQLGIVTRWVVGCCLAGWQPETEWSKRIIEVNAAVYPSWCVNTEWDNSDACVILESDSLCVV